MVIDILTIFPKMFNDFLSTSIIARAISQEIVQINVIDIRTYTKDKNGQKKDNEKFNTKSLMVSTLGVLGFVGLSFILFKNRKRNLYLGFDKKIKNF